MDCATKSVDVPSLLHPTSLRWRKAGLVARLVTDPQGPESTVVVSRLLTRLLCIGAPRAETGSVKPSLGIERSKPRVLVQTWHSVLSCLKAAQPPRRRRRRRWPSPPPLTTESEARSLGSGLGPKRVRASTLLPLLLTHFVPFLQCSMYASICTG